MVNDALSVISLAVTVALCLMAIHCKCFRENWLQWFGLWGMVITGTAQFVRVMADGEQTSTYEMLMYVAIALYAIGTTIKVRGYANRLVG